MELGLVKASPPKNAGKVRSFLGLANTCHDHVPDYSQRELTNNHIFNWNNTRQRAFDQIKKKLAQAPTLTLLREVC